ncbi:AAA family ATPase [Nostoc sp.]|uniref:AAA family ATPase n=1 Tax=Nostoc sp. TaxID=1180 RepID=UPI002FFC7231
MIIGLTNQKGGAGKTTVSGHLAYWLSQQGTMMIVDADAQQSSTNWMKDLQRLFLNQAKKGTVLLKDAQRALSEKNTGFPLLKTMIYDLQVIADAPGQGTTVWGLSGATAKLAPKDFEALFTEALGVANDKR